MKTAWDNYKMSYEHNGDGALKTGRAWDSMNRACKEVEDDCQQKEEAGSEL